MLDIYKYNAELNNIDISFNSIVYSNSTVPPNLTGITYWYGNTLSAAGLSTPAFTGWRTQMIYPIYNGQVGVAYPLVTMNWNAAGSPPHWSLNIF